MEEIIFKKKANLILEAPIIHTKTKNNIIQIEEEKYSFNEKVSIHSVQKQLSILKFEEAILITSLITLAVLGRILLQPFPSIEPITFIALLAGSLFGIRKGALVGASSWYLSNFFMFGGQGPWTLVHIGSGIVAGVLGGIMLKKPTAKKTMDKTTLFLGPRGITTHFSVQFDKIPLVIKSIIAITISTLIFELAINTMSGLLFYGLIISFITAIPFTITHLTSNLILSLALSKSRTIIFKKGKLDQIPMCQNLLKELNQKRVEANEV